MTWQCKRCGLCCLKLEQYCVDNDAHEARKFMELRGFQCDEAQDGRVRILIDAVCEWLIFEDGRAVCLNYDERPAICQRYTCEGKSFR